MDLKRAFLITAGFGSALALAASAGPRHASAADIAGVPVGNLEASAPDDRADVTDLICARLKSELAKLYPGAKIELTGSLRWTRGKLPGELDSLSFRGEDSRGNAYFGVNTASSDSGADGWVSFAAWVPARISVRRIHPGERLSPELFATQDVNIAVGQAHEYRGILLDKSVPITGLQTRQTILEGGLLLSSAVERIPDVRRGDFVRILLQSGGLSLTTTGTAEEPAYLNDQVRVMAAKTKRELVGKLTPGGIVEVSL